MCGSRSGLLVFILAGIVLALCLTLVEITAFTAFWPVFGLNAVFIVGIAVVVAALHCHVAVSIGRRLGIAESLIFFVVVQTVVLTGSLLIIIAEPLLAPLELLAQKQPGFFLFRNLLFALIGGFAVSRYLALQQHWRDQVRAESRSRLDSLQARIRPHFLFNALNTISSLIHERPDQAEQATVDLSDLLRTGLRDNPTHSLEDELELIRGYLRIESLRLGERLQVEWALAGDLPVDRPIPALLLQPLVENAVIHGIARLPEGGVLRICGEPYRKSRVRFVVENPVLKDESANKQGLGMGLDNIRQRLDLAFEEGARLRTEIRDGVFRVVIVIPV